MAVDIGIVVGNSGASTAGDQELFARIEDLGFAPVFVDDGAVVPVGIEGFVIADSAVAATVGTKYDALALPVVTLRFDVWTANRLATTTGAATATSTDLDLVAHTVTTGLADPLTVLTSTQAQRGVLTADLPAGASIFARPGADATRVAGWTFETGAAMTSGTAPARRAALHLPEAWTPILTLGGVALFDALIEWAFRPYTLTYDATLSRVRIAADGFGQAAVALIERSTNQVSWTPVRGGESAAVTAGAVQLDDYEFTPGVANYYRITVARDAHTAGIAFAGAPASANNAAVVPALPTSARAKYLILLFAGIRDESAGVIGVPAGYTTLWSAGHIKLMAKVHSGTEAAPTVTVSGGAAGSDVQAQTFAVRNVAATVTASAAQLNPASAVAIAYPTLNPVRPHQVLMALGWAKDDWTSVNTLVGFTEIGDASSTIGNDQGMVWDWAQQMTAAAATVPAGSFALVGGTSAISRGALVALAPLNTVLTRSVVPTQTGVWIKNLTRPFLNRQVTVVGHSDIEMPDRTGLHEIIGRSFPVAVTDVRGSRRQTLTLMFPTLALADEFRECLATGGPIFLQVPTTGCPFPGMYAVVGTTTIHKMSQRGVRRYFTLPLTEVAAPASTLIGATLTYQTVLSSYASYDALLAAEGSYNGLMEGIGTPADVVVP
jgi:hypothetical protein